MNLLVVVTPPSIYQIMSFQEEYATLHILDKKTQNRAKDLDTAQMHVELPCKRLITPLSKLFLPI